MQGGSVECEVCGIIWDDDEFECYGQIQGPDIFTYGDGSKGLNVHSYCTQRGSGKNCKGKLEEKLSKYPKGLENLFSTIIYLAYYKSK